ncbi:MAG: hypothetical protein ACRCZB_05495 [Bacteroidales bacterium]
MNKIVLTQKNVEQLATILGTKRKDSMGYVVSSLVKYVYEDEKPLFLSSNEKSAFSYLRENCVKPDDGTVEVPVNIKGIKSLTELVYSEMGLI